MKVSKIILASLLGAVAISGAFADEFDGPRNRCKAKSDKIWLEEVHSCVPKNPCTTGTEEEKNEYCDEITFSNISLSYLKAASVLEMEHIVRGEAGFIGNKSATESSLVEPRPYYISSYARKSGRFKVYKFANAEEGDSAMVYLNAECLAVRGEGTPYYNEKGLASIDCKTPYVEELVSLKLIQKFVTHTKKTDEVVTISFTEDGCYGYTDCISK